MLHCFDGFHDIFGYFNFQKNFWYGGVPKFHSPEAIEIQKRFPEHQRQEYPPPVSENLPKNFVQHQKLSFLDKIFSFWNSQKVFFVAQVKQNCVFFHQALFRQKKKRK
jgi:hypothetical protein